MLKHARSKPFKNKYFVCTKRPFRRPADGQAMQVNITIIFPLSFSLSFSLFHFLFSSSSFARGRGHGEWRLATVVAGGRWGGSKSRGYLRFKRQRFSFSSPLRPSVEKGKGERGRGDFRCGRTAASMKFYYVETTEPIAAFLPPVQSGWRKCVVYDKSKLAKMGFVF